jgi:hypothetical protein
LAGHNFLAHDNQLGINALGRLRATYLIMICYYYTIDAFTMANFNQVGGADKAIGRVTGMAVELNR